MTEQEVKRLLQYLTTKEAWSWISNAKLQSDCMFYMQVIIKLIKTQLQEEGKDEWQAW